jgi:hypothetical protein
MVGVLPGIGPVAGITILMPFTFGMDLTPAMVMMAGIYYGAMYGGSTTSILVAVPGETSSIVTILDGHQMAKKGRAGAALALSAIGSFVAGTVGILGLTFLAPPLAELAIGFGPPEYFALALVGLSMSSFLSNASLAKGLAMAVVGLIIGTVGLMFLSVWDLVLHDSMQSFMTPEMRSAAGRSMPDGIASPFGTIMMPFLLILWLFVVSGMLHLFLMLVHGVKAGFEATFRVVSYSLSPFLIMAIPYCGMMITMPWVLILTVIGLRDAHETTGGKATVAVLFPFLFCCGMMVLAAVLFMGTIAASFGSMMHMYK